MKNFKNDITTDKWVNRGPKLVSFLAGVVCSFMHMHMHIGVQPYTSLGSDAHITLFLISQLLSPRILCFTSSPPPCHNVSATLSLIPPCQKDPASASASHSSGSTCRYSSESLLSFFRLKSPLSSASYQSCVPCSVIHLPHLSDSANLTCRQK